MSFIPTPTDQPDWIESGSAYGDPLDTQTPPGAGVFFGNMVECGGSPSTIVSVLCSDPVAQLNISMQYFNAGGTLGYGVTTDIAISGLCIGAIIIPNIAPIEQLLFTIAALAGGSSLLVTTYQCGVQVNSPECIQRGVLMGNAVLIGAGGNLVIPGNAIGAGQATLTIIPSATKWTAIVFGRSSATHLITAVGDSAGPLPKSQQFNLEPGNPNIQITNSDAVARTFVYSLCV